MRSGEFGVGRGGQEFLKLAGRELLQQLGRALELRSC